LGIGELNAIDVTPTAVFAASQQGRAGRWPASGDGAGLEFSGHTAPYSQIRVSPDEALVAGANDDGYTTVWAATAGVPVFSVRSATRGEAWGVAFSPDGGLLATTSQAGEVSLWHVPDGRYLGTVDWDDKRGMAGVAFSPDGRKLVTSNGSGSIWVLKLTDRGDPPQLPTPRPGLRHEELPAGAPASERARFLIKSYAGDQKVLHEALALCADALAANPRDVGALVQRARAKRSLSRRTNDDYDLDLLAEATADLDRALEIEPRNLRAHVSKAWHALFAAKTRAHSTGAKLDLTEVHEAVEAVEELRQEDYLVDSLLSEIANEEGRFEESVRLATRMMERAANLDEVEDARETLRDAYTRMGFYRAADALWRSELDSEQAGAWSYGDYARFLLRIGDDSNAMSNVERALGKMDYGVGRSTRADIWADRGVALLWDRRDASRAKEAFQKALDDDSNDPGAKYGLIAVDWFVATGKNAACDDCRDRLKTLAKQRPDFEPAKQALALLDPK
jgi:tetratricopeptide (TPR) repeat protein